MYGYNTNGDYIKDISYVEYFGEPLSTDSMALKVQGYKNNLFNARFMNMNISGEFWDDEVYFEFDATEHHIVFFGTKKGDVMNVSMMCYFSTDAAGHKGMSYALHCQYLKDGTLGSETGGLLTSFSDFDAIKNVVMKADSASVVYGKNGFQNLKEAGSPQTLEIQNIEGTVFSGRMSQVIADAERKTDVVTEVRLSGVITDFYGGNTYCSVMDDTGKYWLMSIYPAKDTATRQWAVSMRTVDVCDTCDSWGQPCAIARDYFSGTPDYSLLPVFDNYSDSIWISDLGYMMHGSGAYREVNVMMELKVKEQRGGSMYISALMANMFGGDMVGVITEYGRGSEIEIYFFDDLNRQYVAYLSIDPENKNMMWMTSTYLVDEKTGGAFRLLFHKVPAKQPL